MKLTNQVLKFTLAIGAVGFVASSIAAVWMLDVNGPQLEAPYRLMASFGIVFVATLAALAILNAA